MQKKGAVDELALNTTQKGRDDAMLAASFPPPFSFSPLRPKSGPAGIGSSRTRAHSLPTVFLRGATTRTERIQEASRLFFLFSPPFFFSLPFPRWLSARADEHQGAYVPSAVRALAWLTGCTGSGPSSLPSLFLFLPLPPFPPRLIAARRDHHMVEEPPAQWDRHGVFPAGVSATIPGCTAQEFSPLFFPFFPFSGQTARRCFGPASGKRRSPLRDAYRTIYGEKRRVEAHLLFPFFFFLFFLLS